MKKSLLKEAIKAFVVELRPVNEALPPPVFDRPRPMFELIDMPKGIIPPAKAQGGPAIVREIVMKFPVELAEAMGVAPEYMEQVHKNGVVDEEFEFYIDFKPYYNPGTRSTYTDPGDPEEFMIEEYIVEGFFLPFSKAAVMVSKEDGLRLAEHLGPLTEDEVESFREQHLSDLEPDYDDRDDFDDGYRDD